jgi:ankyrin repeat protein
MPFKNNFLNSISQIFNKSTQEDFEKAVQYNMTKRVIDLLRNKNINPSLNNNNAISYAAENGFYNIVCILLNDPRVDPSDNDNYTIKYAAQQGHSEIVKVLLRDKRINPTHEKNMAILMAERFHKQDVIDVLWKDSRVKGTLKNDYEPLFNLLTKRDIKEKVGNF